MERFVFTLALLASTASAATWGTKAFAFHGRVSGIARGTFSLAHLICMQGTFDRLLMVTPQGQPEEPLVLASILNECEADLLAAGLIQPGINPYFVRNNGTWTPMEL